MDRADIEGDALALYRLARLEPDQPVAISRLVRALLDTPIQVASFTRGKAHLAWHTDQWWIYVRAGIAAPRLRFGIGHELAHWWYRRCGYSGEDIELRCDALGAALVAPMPLFSAVRKRTSRIVQIAHAIGSTQSLALLREGEVLVDGVGLGLLARLVQDARQRRRCDARRSAQRGRAPVLIKTRLLHRRTYPICHRFHGLTVPL